MMEHFTTAHMLRMSPDEWPEPVVRSLSHLNPAIYGLMQGPSELAVSGTLKDWDRTADLPKITVPTLILGARYDSMDPAHLEWMAGQLPNGQYHHCPNGSHFAFVDDQESYFDGLIRFLSQLEPG
jgi:proline iminopeptidase